MALLFHVMLLQLAVPLHAIYLDTSIETPARFYIEREVRLPKPSSSRLLGAPLCSASDVFSLTTALEIAYFRHTGSLPKFSEQEIIDCYMNGCRTGSGDSLEQLVKWLEVHDRLSPEDKYASYGSTKRVCRSARAPDGLVDIRVTGLASITAEEFESAIVRYGSVLACISTENTVCPSYHGYGEGILDGRSSDSCDHFVTIVGYNVVDGIRFYKVKNDRGSNWGENGYFRILRGKNACGIESHMSVLLTEPRTEPKDIYATSGCPDDFPVYCSETKTCRSHKQYCVPRNTSDEDRQNELDKERMRVTTRIATQRRHLSLSLPEHCRDNPRYNCQVLFNKCNYRKVQDVCGATCQVCDSEGDYRCKDQVATEGEKSCARLKSYCRISTNIMIKCPRTCNMNPLDCGTETQMVKLLVRHEKPSTGTCWAPDVKNGRVLNNFLLTVGEKLKIECNEGYVLAGEQNYCEVQNVFGPDSRLIQYCQENPGDHFIGSGIDYMGSLSTTISGRRCQNWKKMAVVGDFEEVEFGREMLRLGNHNFCRNPWGQDMAPYCIVRGGSKEFCYRGPNCGGDQEMPCGTTKVDPYPYCSRFNPANCYLSHERAQNRVDWYWRHCPGFCCQHLGCQ